MPNWCENQVRINGPVDKIYNMAKAVEEELLEHLVPVEGTNLDRTDKWGTQMGYNPEPHMEHNIEDGVIEVSFMTAWGPPDACICTYLGK